MNNPTLGLHYDADGLALTLAIVLGVLLILLPRRYALVPLVLATCFLPVVGKYVVAGLNFSMLRLVLTFAFARIIVRKEYRNFTWLSLDTVIVVWIVVRVLAFALLWENAAALVNGLGYAYDDLGLYFVFRVYVESPQNFKQVIRIFALALVPLAILMCTEKVTATNPFHIFGGVPEFTEIRQGTVRAQGPFGHPILAGTFGASWIPLFAALWIYDKGSRKLATVGILSGTLVVIAAGSSGPVGTYLAGAIGLLMWALRRHMRAVRWGIVACILALHAVMKDPVWFIFARVDVFSGSTGWHRSNLIDKSISNFGDWWLIGTRDIVPWGVFAGDTTNQFIAEGIRAGFFNMALFVAIIVVGFSYVGRTVRATRNESTPYRFLLWSVGVALFAHTVSFLGVAYFDQNVVNFFLVLAMTAAAFRNHMMTSGSRVPKAAFIPDPEDSAHLPGRQEPSLEFALSHFMFGDGHLRNGLKSNHA